jgi:hypothetical protein
LLRELSAVTSDRSGHVLTDLCDTSRFHTKHRLATSSQRESSQVPAIQREDGTSELNAEKSETISPICQIIRAHKYQ